MKNYKLVVIVPHEYVNQHAKYRNVNAHDLYSWCVQGRLNSEAGGGAWCPQSMIGRQDKRKEYLEIDLLVDHAITAIVIQGRFANGLGQEFTECFMLQFWREGLEDFVEYGEDEEEGEAFVLPANTNTKQWSRE